MAKQPNFTILWERLKREAENSGNDRMLASLKNHEHKKEHICRRLGVVTEMDINRIFKKQ